MRVVLWLVLRVKVIVTKVTKVTKLIDLHKQEHLLFVITPSADSSSLCKTVVGLPLLLSPPLLQQMSKFAALERELSPLLQKTRTILSKSADEVTPQQVLNAEGYIIQVGAAHCGAGGGGGGGGWIVMRRRMRRVASCGGRGE
jgi:hypothetical protein